ncbi:MAG TPA: hypothetical protein ENK72_00640 [Epsilonproteobacteria bacterium]|nr:hypothetical protein [Campylobacterota bacterium]
MTLKSTTKALVALVMSFGFAYAGVTAEFHGMKGNASEKVKAFTETVGDIGYMTVANNENIQNFYFKQFNVKNLEYISFYTMINLEEIRELLLQNPDFGAFAPFNFLAYKTLDTTNDNMTWYGHLNPDLMLDIIGCKHGESKEKFKKMVGSLDAHAAKALKADASKKVEFTKPLPKATLTKMVKKFERPEDIESFVEDFINKHNTAFTQHKFIIAGFIDIKFEYSDLELEFEKYDAYWVSSLCHFKFSNAVFNQNIHPQAGAFAPCSIYFYIPQGSNELHMGYAGIENWVSTTGIEDEALFKFMREIDDEVVTVFEELGFELTQQTGNGDRERQKNFKTINKEAKPAADPDCSDA